MPACEKKRARDMLVVIHRQEEREQNVVVLGTACFALHHRKQATEIVSFFCVYMVTNLFGR